jgi:hypothetical protein
MSGSERGSGSDGTSSRTVRRIRHGSDSLTRNFFGTRFQLATDAEQRYLAAMASLGEPPYATGEVAHTYGAKGQRGVSILRDALIQKGIIWAPRRGRLDFTVPLFAECRVRGRPRTYCRSGQGKLTSIERELARVRAARFA